jgi:capsular polysaccharide export protein
MNSDNYILAYAEEINKFNFYKRFYPAITELSYEIILLTNRISFFLINRKNLKIRLVKKIKYKNYNGEIPITREIRDNSLTEKEAKELYWAVYYEAEKEQELRNIKYVFIFGGTSAPEKALVQFAEDYKIRTLYLEYANIPDKIFVDPIGTNARSRLGKDISILEKYIATMSDYEIWRKKYLRVRGLSHIPPQAKKRKKTNLFYIIDHLAFRLLRVPLEDNHSFIYKLKRKLFWKKHTYLFDYYDLQKGKYIFFPMQVSNDAQILFHSNINNSEGIEYAAKAAKSDRLDLLVKPHPAETNPDQNAEIIELKKKHGFYLVNEPVMNILQYCQRVITINSTVGLEAKILGKQVDFLGKTFYRNLDDRLMKNYLLSYLIEIDFFDNSNIGKDKIEDILKRAD